MSAMEVCSGRLPFASSRSICTFLVMASPVVPITGALSRIGHATALSNDQADCGSYTATFDTDMSEVFGSHAPLS